MVQVKFISCSIINEIDEEVDVMEKKRKGRLKIGFRGVILAMLIALLLFLGWDGMNVGSGNGDEAETIENGQESDLESSNKNPESNLQEVEQEFFAIYVVEERIYLDAEDGGSKLVETDLVKLKDQLSPFDKKESRIIVYDGGALSGTYEDVINLVKSYDFIFSEESISLENERF